METRKKGNRFIAIGLLLLIAALCLVVYNIYDSMRAAAAANEAAATLQKQMSDGHDPDYLTDPDIPMPMKEIDGQEYVAVIEIPELELVLPVISECSYEGLKIAPCRYSGSAYKDNLVIAAHNYRQHFGEIKELDSGDEIYVVDMDGNIFKYQAAMIEILQATDVEKMKSAEWDLTLFTCTIGGQARVTIRCTRQ